MMRIVVATDGSAHALKAAEVAARLARELREVEILLVNVGHIPVLALGGPGPDAMVDLGALEEGLERAGRAILEKTAHAFAGIDAPVKRIYRHGEPSGEILREATASRVDLIVMGSRGLGHLGGLILGSVSERVLHGAHCPVLIVR